MLLRPRTFRDKVVTSSTARGFRFGVYGFSVSTNFLRTSQTTKYNNPLPALNKEELFLLGWGGGVGCLKQFVGLGLYIYLHRYLSLYLFLQTVGAVYIYIYIYVYIFIYIYINISVYIYIYISIYLYIYVSISLYIYIYAYTLYLYVSIHMYLSICIYQFIYLYVNNVISGFGASKVRASALRGVVYQKL